MARYRRGKMALYEVMSKAKEKPGYKRTLENIRAGKPGEEEPIAEAEEKDESVVAEDTAETMVEPPVGSVTAIAQDEASASEEVDAVGASGLSVKWRRKPRVVQYNNGRVEFSIPYQIGIAAVLGLVVVMLLTFRIGQRSVVVDKAVSNDASVDPGTGRRPPVMNRNEGVPKETIPAKATTRDSGNAGAATVSMGSSAIVLVQYTAERDLVPVRAHFANHGIATEIVRSGSVYFLRTQDRYDSVKSGAGYLAKQRIIEAGADYKGKAPAGYETFASHYFSDAYLGKKVN